MGATGCRAPQQTRSQQTLERILSSSTTLISKKSYDDVSIAEIAARAQISVGGFYSRFENKKALFSMLETRLGQETQDRIDAALDTDWSETGLHELLHFVVANNAEIYEKYRGVLTAVHVRTRILKSRKEDDARRTYNESLVAQIETLLLNKRDEIQCRRPRVAIRTAIACMSAMLRDAIVFGDTSLYPKPGSTAIVTRQVADVMYRYLTAEAP